MPPIRSRLLMVAVAVGVAAGACLPAASYGLFLTHVVCSKGSELGSSGPIETPFSIAAAPPGGMMLFTDNWWDNWTQGDSWYSYGSTRGTFGDPVNNTQLDFGVYNWTLNAVGSSIALGPGSSTACPHEALTPGPSTLFEGAAILPPVPAGVGNRVVVPSNLSVSSPYPLLAGVSSAVVNGSYSPTPAFTFTWSGSTSGVLLPVPSTIPFPLQFGEYQVGGSVVGLSLQINVPVVSFGVPVHLVAGGTTVIPASLQLNDPNMTAWLGSVTYIFPLTTDQGTWSAYIAGADSHYPLGGLLFVRTG